MIELPRKESWFALTFGVGGTAQPLQLEGWSFPEPEFTWSTGSISRLRLPPFCDGSAWLLILEGQPFLWPPKLTAQVVRLSLAGSELVRIRVNRAFNASVRIPAQNAGGSSVLEFHYPDGERPAAFGAPDQRRLAIAWRRIIFVPVPAADTTQIRTTVGHRADDDAGNDAASQREPETVPYIEVSQCLRRGDVRSAERALCAINRPKLSLHFDKAVPDDISLVSCVGNSKEGWRFGFPATWLDKAASDDVCRMVAWRWLAMLPLFAAYARSARVSGSVMLNLGDEAHGGGLAFCCRSSEARLVPDPYFMQSRGYEKLRQAFAAGAPPFTARKPVGFWRGSSTGYHGPCGVLGMPRVQLCRFARLPENVDLIDAGFTDFVQLQSDEDLAQLTALDLRADFVAPEQLPEWRYLIDIDGNTSSWPGLFQKLLSGSVVLKIDSVDGWRQWYYERLRPFDNFVPVSSDLNDLAKKIKYLSYNESYASEIAENGRALALSMSYDVELARAVEVMEEAILQEQLRVVQTTVVYRNN